MCSLYVYGMCVPFTTVECILSATVECILFTAVECSLYYCRMCVSYVYAMCMLCVCCAHAVCKCVVSTLRTRCQPAAHAQVQQLNQSSENKKRDSVQRQKDKEAGSGPSSPNVHFFSQFFFSLTHTESTDSLHTHAHPHRLIHARTHSHPHAYTQRA